MAKKPIYVMLDAALHARMKSAAPLRGTNVQGAYDQALHLWLSGETGTGKSVDDDLHQKLEAILTSNHENAIGMARGMIEAAYAITRSGLTNEQIEAFAASAGQQPVGESGSKGPRDGEEPEGHLRKRVPKSA